MQRYLRNSTKNYLYWLVKSLREDFNLIYYLLELILSSTTLKQSMLEMLDSK